MVRANLKGVFATYEPRKDGTRKTYWYHRATGKRLRGEPGSAEFISDYAEAAKCNRERLANPDTFNGLIRDYTLPEEFRTSLAPSTRAEYQRLLTKAEREFGDMAVPALDDWRVRQDFLNWREKVARESGPREADYRLSAISSMLTWAVKRGRLSVNQLKGFTRLYKSHRAQIIWLPEHILAFMKVAPIELQQALILGLHTGLREGDLLRLPWSAYDGNKICVRPGKSRRGDELGDEIEIPCTKALRRMLNRMKRRSPLILTTATGRAFKKRYFSQLWSRAMRDAGIETVTLPKTTKPVRLHFHDLRGTTVTLLSEAGNNPQQIATITGHSLRTVHQIMEGYLARTHGLAEQAISNFENSPRTKFANRLKTSVVRRTNANRNLKKKR